jgi:hypothetical protein
MNLLMAKYLTYNLVTRVSTRGIVKVNFRVILKDLKKLGYDVTPSTVLRLSEFPILDKDANWSQHKKQQEPTSSEIEKEQDATSVHTLMMF